MPREARQEMLSTDILAERTRMSEKALERMFREARQTKNPLLEGAMEVCRDHATMALDMTMDPAMDALSTKFWLGQMEGALQVLQRMKDLSLAPAEE